MFDTGLRRTTAKAFAALTAAFGALVLASCATPAAAPTAALAAYPAIDTARIAADITVLASDAYEGRGPASAGEMKSIAYITDAMKAAGLQPGGDNGTWLQRFQLTRFAPAASTTLTVVGPDAAKSYRQADDIAFGTRKNIGSIDIRNAPLVFAGYGVVAPEQNWNDYAGVDWKGKIAVVLINDPDFEADLGGAFGGKAMTYYGRWDYKFEEAARQGALGVLIVHQDAPAAYGWGVVRNSFTDYRYDFVRDDKGASLAAVEGWLTEATSRELFARAGMNFDSMKVAARQRGFKPVPMGDLRAAVSMPITTTAITTHNVLGVLPGTVPQESILLGAHYDHVGIGPEVDGDRIYNGAVDNASGVAAMLEIARSMAGGPKPRRSVVFAAWGAEEIGLLGSLYYSENPTVDLTRMAAGFNLDGLALNGPTRNVVVIGAGKSSLEDILATHAAKQGRRVEPEEFPERGSFYRSDHFSFAKQGVPVIYTKSGSDLVNGGREAGLAIDRDYITNRYHKPQDEINPRWNFAGAAEEATLLRGMMAEVANGTVWPAWRPTAEFGPIRARSAAARTP